ncbi:MAG: dehydrogenase, partial [Verrucomicrobiota bacterium]
MRQLFQRLDSGLTELAEVPAPGPAAGRVLVRTTRTLVSPGTERMLVEFGRSGWIGKALAQPERVRAVIARIRAEGPAEAFAAVRRRLAEPVALGYCQAGAVLDGGG